MNDHETRIDRIRGAIFGQAIGDALGLGTEFLSKKKVQFIYPSGLSHYSQIIQDNHRERWKQGQWTDDTDQMLCILDSILSKGQIDTLDIAQRIFNWAKSGGMGLGQTVWHVLNQENFLQDPQNAARKVWEDTGRELAANGAVMRTSALGLWQLENDLAVCQNAEAVCKITHFDPRCVASCVAVSLAVAHLVRGQNNVDELIEEITPHVEKIDSRVVDCFKLAQSKSIAALQLDEGLNPGEVDRIGYTLKATAAGFWSIKNCQSVESGIRTVIEEGGDADSNAAVAGALLGALLGYKSIDTRLIENLVGHQELWTRAEQLLELLELQKTA
ncbi:ADP-ribosylglycohydrolase family protein [bacterium]|nr:ADP-ribosylglycohydrolase family protein [bacterium]MBP9809527.1 ADP-ribosylglycohydrolase family protein [bacterium]